MVPILGRTVIRKKRADKQVGLIYIPDSHQGQYQEDWEAEVVAVAEQGGWRSGVLNVKFEESHAHLEQRHPGDLTKAERTDSKLWRIMPYFVEKPEVMPGRKVMVCWLSGQPFNSMNGYDYYLTDGEHAYKAVINQ